MIRSRVPLFILFFHVACTAATGAELPAIPKLTRPPVAAPEARFDSLFRPPGTDRAALSPDGKYLAYTLRDADELSVVIVEVDQPGKPTAYIKVVSDEQATAMMDTMARAKTVANIRWMRWVTPTRLVMETNRTFAALQEGGSQDWLNTSGEIIGVDADGKNAKPLVTPKDVAEWSAASGSNFGLPRSPRIAGLCQDDPESVWVQTEGLQRSRELRDVERYRLNVITGKTKSITQHTVSVTRAYLFDNNGRPRVAIPISTRDAFPHEFLYDTGERLRPWKPMNALVAGKLTPGFTISPGNYFSQRCVPLGFGLSPDILYYASNLGRDTYGIYSLNIKTGEKGPFIAESPAFDLYAPVAGVFPDTGGGTLVVSDSAIPEPVETSETEPASPSTASTEGPTDSSSTASTTGTATGASTGFETRKRAKTTARSASLLGNLDAAPLIIDRFTHEAAGFRYEGKTKTTLWFHPKLATVQATLEGKFPGRSIELIDWDSTYKRFLLRVSGNIDSGAFYIYEAAPQVKLMEFMQCHPWLSREKLHRTSPFSYRDAEGRTISGTFTFPKTARYSPVPVIVLCGAQPWERIHTTFDPEVQAYAEMGFAVLQVNPRRAWGFGWKQRVSTTETPEAGEIADILGTVDQLARQFAINPKRIAIAGKSHGGYLALRALQLHPGRFRCAIAVEPVLDIKSWLGELRWTSADAGARMISSFFGDPASLPASPVMEQPEKITRPVLLMSYRGDPGVDEPNNFLRAKQLHRSIAGRGLSGEFIELGVDYQRNAPTARAEAFRQIEEFLNNTLYDFEVKAGELRTIEMEPARAAPRPAPST